MRLFVQGAVLLLGMGFLSAPAKAQKVVIEDDAPNSIVLVSQDKAGDEIVRIMNETQSPRFHDPKAPRFVLTDRKGRFALGIGGYVKATAEYDFGGISDDVDFYPSMIPNGGQNYVRNPVPDGRYYQYDIFEISGSYQTPRGFRRVYGG